MQPKSKKSIHMLDDDEDSDVSQEQSEDGDNEEDVSEHDEELMNLDPKALKNKIASEVCQILKYMFMILFFLLASSIARGTSKSSGEVILKRCTSP